MIDLAELVARVEAIERRLNMAQTPAPPNASVYPRIEEHDGAWYELKAPLPREFTSSQRARMFGSGPNQRGDVAYVPDPSNGIPGSREFPIRDADGWPLWYAGKAEDNTLRGPARIVDGSQTFASHAERIATWRALDAQAETLRNYGHRFSPQ